jgi:hypothetical protein
MRTPILLSTALIAALAGATAFAQTLGARPDTAEVIRQLESRGFTDIREFDFDDGFYEVEARSPNGRRVELTVDPASGDILHPDYTRLLSAAEIATLLEQGGYTDVRSIERDDGLYEAEALTAAGQAVELKLDPRDGRVVREELDD